MKKSSTLTQFMLFWSICLLLVARTFQTAQAQGFYTPTDHAYFHYPCRIEVMPDGYLVKPTYEGSNPPTRIFGTVELNAAGQEIGWDSTVVPTALNTKYRWLPDNDILTCGPLTVGNPVYKVEKKQLDGTVLWGQLFGPTLEKQVFSDIAQNADGDIFVVGYEYNAPQSGGATNMLLRKFKASGTLLWTVVYPLRDSISVELEIKTPTHDGGLLVGVSDFEMTGYFTELVKFSDSGARLWSQEVACCPGKIIENSQGEIYNYGNPYNVNTGESPVTLEKLDASGNLLWSKTIDAVFFPNDCLILAENEDVLIGGVSSNLAQGGLHHYFKLLSPDGNERWNKEYPFLTQDWSGLITGGAATPDNGFVISGWVPVTDRLFVLKIDENGGIYPGQISGKLALDGNVNCLNDTTEQGLKNLKIKLASPNISLYTTTNSEGEYKISDVPGDDYLLSARAPSSVWESCVGEVQVVVPDSGTTSIVQDFPMQVLEDCPLMTLDIATPFLRRCFSNNYTVSYCNEGSISADSVYIQIVLDPLLIFNAATIPNTQIGDTLNFSVGAVPPLECGQFTFNVTVDCDSTELGETICISGSIFPDFTCTPASNWTGAMLHGSGECIGDSVRFLLRNIGTAPSTGGLNSFVVDEHVIMVQQQIPSLLPNETFEISVEANGNTKRLLADQEPNAPGMEKPSIGVEGCGQNGATNWGFMLQFLNRDGNPFTDTDCHQVVGSFDPNDKQAFPEGVTVTHLIEANTPIAYMIRFQNTGTDTAFTVVVKDTISAWLDPASVRAGAASHPYAWTISGEGILTFTFEHILLPDSNSNEAASHGFIQFNIEQQKDLLNGVVVENRAGIYFDFNAPVMTNTVFHTIGENFLVSGTKTPVAKQSLLEIWPNPAIDITTVRLEKLYKPGQRLVLRNALGNVLKEMPLQGQTTKLQRSGLPAGFYFIEIWEEKKVLAIGKIIWD